MPGQGWKELHIEDGRNCPLHTVARSILGHHQWAVAAVNETPLFDLSSCERGERDAKMLLNFPFLQLFYRTLQRWMLKDKNGPL